MLGIADKVRINSCAMFSYGRQHTDASESTNQQEVNQLCVDNGYSVENLLLTMDSRDLMMMMMMIILC